MISQMNDFLLITSTLKTMYGTDYPFRCFGLKTGIIYGDSANFLGDVEGAAPYYYIIFRSAVFGGTSKIAVPYDYCTTLIFTRWAFIILYIR